MSESVPRPYAASLTTDENANHEPVVEFVGTSNETIGAAVRQALAAACRALPTLDGAGVLVIPQLARNGAPRYRVTLQITPDSDEGSTLHSPHAPPPPTP